MIFVCRTHMPRLYDARTPLSNVIRSDRLVGIPALFRLADEHELRAVGGPDAKSALAHGQAHYGAEDLDGDLVSSRAAHVGRSSSAP
jgi:hypothetical protein